MTASTDVFVPSSSDLASIAELVWASFVDGEIYPDPQAGERAESSQVSAGVSITGEWNGHVVVSASPTTAREIAAAMFALDAADVGDNDLSDAFGEIANIVGGNVKALMPEPSVLSLPHVVLDARAVRMPSATLVSRADLCWRGEPVNLMVWEGHTSSDSSDGGQ